MFVNYLLVAAGAVFGVLARVLMYQLIKRKWTRAFPLATFSVNLSGALLLGLMTGMGFGIQLSLLFGTGFISTYTTFSTFNLENIELLRRKKTRSFIISIAGTYTLGISAIFIGMLMGAALKTTIGI